MTLTAAPPTSAARAFWLLAVLVVCSVFGVGIAGLLDLRDIIALWLAISVVAAIIAVILSAAITLSVAITVTAVVTLSIARSVAGSSAILFALTAVTALTLFRFFLRVTTKQ